jgi:uncharacterized protein
MKPTIHCVTLPVDDLKRSFRFYKNGLGLSAGEPDETADHVAFTLEDKLYLVIILREEFAKFTTMANQPDAPKGTSECVLSYFTVSREEVDTILGKAEIAGGVLTGTARDQPWGYAGFFKDPDGHLWEIMYNPGLQKAE